MDLDFGSHSSQLRVSCISFLDVMDLDRTDPIDQPFLNSIDIYLLHKLVLYDLGNGGDSNDFDVSKSKTQNLLKSCSNTG